MSDVVVHGLGYIGLPTAAMLANYGHDVTGYDTDPEIRRSLQDGDVHLEEPGLRAFVTEAFESGTFDLGTEVRPAAYHVICVPTPLDQDSREADLSYVEAAGEAIRPHLREGDTVILESTVPPRTTRDFLRPAIEPDDLAIGSDVALVHSPETVLPGNIITEIRENDRVVGGVDGTSPEAAVRLYDSFVEGEIVTAPDARTAEFVKLIQNTYRDANIALANEIAMLAHDYGIDSRDAIGLANRHPRVEIHHPGPGVGGHCLPIDPLFLGHGSDRLDLIAHAREVNDEMIPYVVDLLAWELAPIEAPKIAVLGVAYKGNVADTRNSPGLAIARALQERADHAVESRSRPTTPSDDDGRELLSSVPRVANGGVGEFDVVDVALQDSHVDDQTLSLSSLSDALSGADAAVVATDHDEYTDLDPDRVADRMDGSLVLDTKGILDPEDWKAGPIEFRRI